MLQPVGIAATIEVPSDGASTIAAAIELAREGDTIIVDDGKYRERVMLRPGIVLMSKTMHGAVISGRGRGEVITLAHNTTVAGFVIRGGTVGVLSKWPGCRVAICRITGNRESGIMCVGHLPEIVDNEIVFNKGSGIQGWDVRSTSSSVDHNTIAYNENHGIAVGGNSSITVENCIIAFNAFYGVKTDEAAQKVTLINCNLYRNGSVAEVPAENVLSVDPRFVAPYKMNFRLEPGSECIRAAEEREDMGARASSE